MIKSKTLSDPEWNCQCDGCNQLRGMLVLHPEPWSMNDTVILDANGTPVDFRDYNVAHVVLRHINRHLEDF